MYTTEVEGYAAAAGGSGVYGDAGYQQIYASTKGDDLRLTVERGTLDATSCAALPVPGAEPVDARVQCTPDGDGWVRAAGDRQEYAVTRGDLLVRVNGLTAVAGPDLVRSAAKQARPITSEEFEELYPADEARPGETVERGDITGDNAPNNDVGAGG
ncbi:hypothetical protein LWF15_34840 [Kineosporia rhizophila]|nr:hypothetical protein [Kineosporia rhizophila]MCE0540683.1 hypothetical protein [Kineosporia rhizophila]